MKLLYLFFSFTSRAGTERILIDKMNYLADHLGYDVTVVTYEQGAHPFSYPLSERVKHVDLGTRFFTLYRYNILKRFFLEMQMRKLFYKKFQAVVAQVNPDVICCTTYRDYEIKAVAASKHSCLKVVESHVVKHNTLLIGNKKLLHSAFSRFLARWKMKFMEHHIGKADVVVALTPQDGANWSTVNTTRVIPNMLTCYPADAPHTQCNKRVISVGRISYQKGCDMLVSAWAKVHEQYPEWRLDIYGADENRGEIQMLIDKQQLSDTILLHDPIEQIYDEYLSSDIYVMSSRYEGFGLVLIEAMSCGLPCVSFDCEYGPGSIINDGVNGYLIPAFDVPMMAQRICDLIADANQRASMGAQARMDALSYSAQCIMPQWDEMFRTELGKKGKRV